MDRAGERRTFIDSIEDEDTMLASKTYKLPKHVFLMDYLFII